MSLQKQATPDHPIHELLAKRWSPYAFSDRPVSKDDLLSLFEAARWAPLSYNEQPWSYIVATKANAEEFERLLTCLVEANQAWAKAAPVLAIPQGLSPSPVRVFAPLWENPQGSFNGDGSERSLFKLESWHVSCKCKRYAHREGGQG
jgi:hypothetical protein